MKLIIKFKSKSKSSDFKLYWKPYKLNTQVSCIRDKKKVKKNNFLLREILVFVLKNKTYYSL